MSQAPSAPPPRWGPLSPQNWPQLNNRVPSAGGLQMPHVQRDNAERARQESFTLSGTILIPAGVIATGQVFNLYLPTDQDGDFWCDQIFSVAWVPGIVPDSFFPIVSTVAISDARTGRALTYPAGVPLYFFATYLIATDNMGAYDPSLFALPDGFRSTTTLAKPFCFTRSGGAQLTFVNSFATTVPAGGYYVDFAFGGWKEYEFASA
jgi:hypothetical protein